MKFYSVQGFSKHKPHFYVLGEEANGGISGRYIHSSGIYNVSGRRQKSNNYSVWSVGFFHNSCYNWKEIKLNKAGRMIIKEMRNFGIKVNLD